MSISLDDFRRNFAMASLLAEEVGYLQQQDQGHADVTTDDEAPPVASATAKAQAPKALPEARHVAVPTAAVPKAVAPKAAVPKAVAVKGRPGRVAAATAAKTPGAPPLAVEGCGREDVPLELPRGGPLLEVADDRARTRAAAKAKAVP